VTGHGDTGAQQRIHRVAMDIAGADTVDTPAPVQYSRAILDQVDRGGDIGGDTRVRPPVDDDIEARADQVQPTQKAVAAAIIPTGGEYAGDRGAVPVGRLGVPRVDAGALGIGPAVAEVVIEVWRVEIHGAFDHPNTHGVGRHRVRPVRQALLVEMHGVEEAIGLPFLTRVLRRVHRLFGSVPFQHLFGPGLLDHHGIDAQLIADPQNRGIALFEVLHRQAQLVEIERRNGTDHLSLVALGQAPGFLGAVVPLLDDDAD